MHNLHQRRSRRLLVRQACLGLLLGGAVLLAPCTASAGPFTRGTLNLGITVGNGHAFNDDYTVIGVGLGYYVANGLELGLGWESWQGGDPDIDKLTPAIRLVFPAAGAARPYVGAFYQRTFIEGFDDIASYGGRAGFFLAGGGNTYFGAGVVYERWSNCDERTYVSCSDTYPEVVFGVSF